MCSILFALILECSSILVINRLEFERRVGDARSDLMILVFGTVCIDRVRRVPGLPPAGGYVEVVAETDFLGGEAANTANALKLWGIDSQLWGNAEGDSLEAEILRNLLSEKGLLNRVNLTDQVTQTPICDIYVTPDGERTMFGKGFSTMEAGVSVEQLPYTKDAWFTAEPNMQNAARRAATLAYEAGMKLYLMDYMDAADVRPGSFWQCSTDWTGTRNNTQKNVAWVQDWVAKTGCFAILSDGPNGFVAGSAEIPVRAYPPYPAPNVVDTTGAGDMFRAGMLFGMEQGWPLAECLQFGSAAGCLKCRALGATTDVPTVDEIRKHVQDHSYVSQQYG
jgi:sugar/nucleoside kinase (ribokinase family)